MSIEHPSRQPSPLAIHDARARVLEAFALHDAIVTIDTTLGDHTIGIDYADPAGNIRYAEIDITAKELD